MKIKNLIRISFIFVLVLTLNNCLNQKAFAKKKLNQPIAQDDIFAEGNQKDIPEDGSKKGNFAVVQALNKTTGKTSILDLKVGEKSNFGTINIITHKCLSSPLDQRPENKILLEIFETKNDGMNSTSEKRIFFGWMFSSSPSISGLEHPIYDIIAINCKTVK